MDMAHFIYLFISQRTFNSLPVLPIVNNDFANMHVQVIVWTCVGMSVAHAPGVELMGHIVVIFLETSYLLF